MLTFAGTHTHTHTQLELNLPLFILHFPETQNMNKKNLAQRKLEHNLAYVFRCGIINANIILTALNYFF